jgi:hypothetical protein
MHRIGGGGSKIQASVTQRARNDLSHGQRIDVEERLFIKIPEGKM